MTACCTNMVSVTVLTSYIRPWYITRACRALSSLFDRRGSVSFKHSTTVANEMFISLIVKIVKTATI